MTKCNVHSRRDFLKLSSKLAGLGFGALSALGREKQANAQAAPSDYKALVCIYLLGGNDGNNLIVPLDSARYGAYQTLRGNLALSGNELLPPIADAAGNSYALHYGLQELNPLYMNGDLAFVLNTGAIERPLTRAQFLAGQHVPTNLFSHSDQTVQAQTGMPTTNGTGWGGRLLECLGQSDSLGAVSVSQPALFLQGFNAGGNVIPPGEDLRLYGMTFWPQQEANLRRQAVDQMLTIDGGNRIRGAANRAMADGLALGNTLAAANNTPPSPIVFPGTSIGNQLKEVAKLIRTRAAAGPGRQVFFCSMDGYDLHSSQDWTHWYLLNQLSQAMYAFHNDIGNSGLIDQVATFTQSEFGRTLQPSGSGSDHAWGNHQLVLGGPVRGGVYGQLPELALGGPDDANNRGVWIPGISTAQFGATLGKWFGASPQSLDWAFPTLTSFSTRDLGFMG